MKTLADLQRAAARYFEQEYGEPCEDRHDPRYVECLNEILDWERDMLQDPDEPWTRCD